MKTALVLVALALALLMPAAASAATFNVTTTSDAVDATPGDAACATAAAACSLRAAVQEANALAGPDEITIPPGTYKQTVLGTNEDAAATGDLDVTGDLTITGAAARAVSIEARPPSGVSSGFDRLIDVVSGTVSISKVTLARGMGSTGGNLRNAGTLTLTDVMLLDGFGGPGSAVSNSGTLSVDRATVADNLGSSGAIASSGTLTVLNATIQHNSGGLWITGGTADVTNATFAGNEGGNGVSIHNEAVTTIRNTILATWSSEYDHCTGTPVASEGYNVDDNGSCGLTGPGDRGWNLFGWTYYKPVNAGGEVDVTPMFDLQSGFSVPGPAPDLVSPSAPCPAIDARGLTRPQGPACDAGAYEIQQSDLVLTVTDAPQHVTAGAVVGWNFTVRNDGPATSGGSNMGFESTIPFQQYAFTHDGSPCGEFGLGCPTGVLAPGESARFRFEGSLDPGAKTGTYSMTQYVRDDRLVGNLDPNSENSKATVSLDIEARPAPVTTPKPPIVPQPKPGACANPKLGTKAADVLTGTAFGDVLTGLAGNDKLIGLAGDDCLDGGAGKDRLDGGTGKDRVSGGSGDDLLVGGKGADVLKGGAGRDVVKAADGTKDTVDCGKGRDKATVDKKDRVKGCERVVRKR